MAKKYRRTKAKSTLQEQIAFLNKANINNTKAREEGPIKKKWAIHDLMRIRALTPAQEDLFHAWHNKKHICAYGTSGTGKTFLGLYLAFQEILDKRYYPNHIIIVRSNVTTREVGHLPGTLDEKMAQFEAPYRDICEELFGKISTYDDMKNAGLIAFMSTSFVRGLTWDNAVVILEEVQNLNEHEIDSIMTRIGPNTRLIITGDIVQSDLLYEVGKNKSGMPQMLKIIQYMNEFEQIHFTQHDIIRSNFVKSWIVAREKVSSIA